MRLSAILIVALLAAPAILTTTTGCRRGVVRTETGLQTGRVNTNRLNNLKRLVARDTGCPVHALEVRELHQGIYEVMGMGCNAVRHYVMGCANRYRCRWEPVVPIEQQAVADMQCRAELVVVQATGDPMSRWVNACGYTAPYQLRCAERTCGWVMTGAPQPSNDPQFAPPPGYGAQVQVQPPGQPAPAPQGQVQSPTVQGTGVEGQVQIQGGATMTPQPAVGEPY